MLVFGGTGDLALHKLLPALYHLHRDGRLPADMRILAAARNVLNRAEYQALAERRCRAQVARSDFDNDTWASFAARLDYLAMDLSQSAEFGRLARFLGAHACNRGRIYYLATAPDLFEAIAEHLAIAGLAGSDTRIVLEKPIGRSLESAREINAAIGAVFSEPQVFRIDHYLGKETVQNLMALRFANILFEPLWNANYIDHVQITVAETVGLEKRAGYYDGSGALRDMVQNHLLQLLCMVAMEPPAALQADAVRDEKLKVLRSLKPIRGEDVAHLSVRGQYRAGASSGAAVPGYLEELGKPDSRTETFVALKAEVDNWRWAGVPFYLRTGKRLAERVSEIVIAFKQIPHSIFDDSAGPVMGNKLVLRLQPDEGVKLWLMIKDPGPGGLRLQHVPLDMSFAEAFGVHQPEAYERLLMDVVRGNQTLFMRRDEVEAAWAWIDPILSAWDNLRDAPKPYTAGSWGPSAAVALVERDGRTWHEDTV